MKKQYRIDYVTKDNRRGVWDYEQDFLSLEKVLEILPERLKYAKTKMPEIKRLIAVEISERDL